MKRIMFISSAGGHLSEMLQLKKVIDSNDSYIVTENTKNNLSLKKKYNNKVSFLLHGSKDHIFTYIFKFIYNTFKSLFLYFKIHPDYIITTGAHTAGMMCIFGKLFGSKVIYIETFANINTKTATGKWVYKLHAYDYFIVQWESMLELYPKAIYGGWIY